MIIIPETASAITTHRILRLHTEIGHMPVGSNISGAAKNAVLECIIKCLISVRLTDLESETPRTKPKSWTSSGFEFSVC
jgi:hypothetical protein